MADRSCIAIDLKSFYASAEGADRKLDPLAACLVVADESRTDKTICLAVSPALKAYGLPGRPRLFEVKEKIRQVNEERRRRAPGRKFRGSSADADELAADPSLELVPVVAVTRMARYIEVSSQICGIYMQYVSPDDIHVYSIDEVFIDATPYLKLYSISARDFAMHQFFTTLEQTVEELSKCWLLEFGESRELSFGRCRRGKSFDELYEGLKPLE